MPELPEVETIVKELNKILPGKTIKKVWTDWSKYIKKPGSFKVFEKEIVGRKIKRVKRAGKNILLDFDKNKTLLIHQKMSGHLLAGRWRQEGGKWIPETNGAMRDRRNQYIHFVFWLSEGKMLVLSDLRKFAKFVLAETDKLNELEDIKELGPDALEVNFKEFKEILTKRKGRIKQALMDQKIISGIGNIYADEILWSAKIHPLGRIERLNDEEVKILFGSMKSILKKAIEYKGNSVDDEGDYRLPSGEKGRYQEIQKAYHREGKPCFRCKTAIKRIKINQRSAHFCPKCQKV